MRHARRSACGSCQTCGRTERAHRSLQNRRRFRTAPTRLIIVPSGRTKPQNLPESFSHRPTDSAEEAKRFSPICTFFKPAAPRDLPCRPDRLRASGHRAVCSSTFVSRLSGGHSDPQPSSRVPRPASPVLFCRSFRGLSVLSRVIAGSRRLNQRAARSKTPCSPFPASLPSAVIPPALSRLFLPRADKPRKENSQ